MALIETNFIRPQEVYDRNTGESKVRYRSYDGNDRFIPVVEGENGVPKTLVEVTHAELKAMRDAGKLTPGALYRITDYNCTTTEENSRSAGHQFDIVLLALSENKLAEEGWAMMNVSNVYDVTFNDGVTKKCWIYQDGDDWYVVDYNNTLYGWVGGKSDFTFDEENRTATYDDSSAMEESTNLKYNYFQNSNLSAWKVWYCLDNDKSRFAWADDSVDNGIACSDGIIYFRFSDDDFINLSNPSASLYAWKSASNNEVFTKGSANPSVGDTVYDDGSSSQGTITELVALPNGRGVIYRLIDEFNNDIKYDFKNIQFKRKITNGQYNANGTETWCYTLNLWYEDKCQDASIVGNTLPNDKGTINGVHGNVFGYVTAYDRALQGVNTFAFALGNNVVLSIDEGGEYYGIYSNTTGDSFFSNTIGNYFYCNMIANKFHLNKIGNNFNSNMIGNVFVNKTISDNTSGKNYGNNGVELATKE